MKTYLHFWHVTDYDNYVKCFFVNINLQDLLYRNNRSLVQTFFQLFSVRAGCNT